MKFMNSRSIYPSHYRQDLSGSTPSAFLESADARIVRMLEEQIEAIRSAKIEAGHKAHNEKRAAELREEIMEMGHKPKA